MSPLIYTEFPVLLSVNNNLVLSLPKEHGSFIFVSLKHAVLLWTLTLHHEHVSAMISLELKDSTDWNACNNIKYDWKKKL